MAGNLSYFGASHEADSVEGGSQFLSIRHAQVSVYRVTTITTITAFAQTPTVHVQGRGLSPGASRIFGWGLSPPAHVPVVLLTMWMSWTSHSHWRTGATSTFYTFYIVHVSDMHAYLLRKEPPPECVYCQFPFMVKHILVTHLHWFYHLCSQYFNSTVSTAMSELFVIVSALNI